MGVAANAAAASNTTLTGTPSPGPAPAYQVQVTGSGFELGRTVDLVECGANALLAGGGSPVASKRLAACDESTLVNAVGHVPDGIMFPCDTAGNPSGTGACGNASNGTHNPPTAFRVFAHISVGGQTIDCTAPNACVIATPSSVSSTPLPSGACCQPADGTAPISFCAGTCPTLRAQCDVIASCAARIGPPSHGRVTINSSVGFRTGLGILVERLLDRTGADGGQTPYLQLVGRVPLGVHHKGRVRIRWNLRVNGQPLTPGRYLVTLRALDIHGNIVALAKPVIYTVS
jgi:hypothetical protein